MPDTPAVRLYSSAEVAAFLRMSECSLRRFLADLGFAGGQPGARRMFTRADLEWLVERRSWLTQASGGVAQKRLVLSVRPGDSPNDARSS